MRHCPALLCQSYISNEFLFPDEQKQILTAQCFPIVSMTCNSKTTRGMPINKM